MSDIFRIDTHHHIVPPLLWKEEKDRVLAMGMGRNDGVIAWTPQRAVEAMDKGGIQTAVTSISTPGVWFGDVAQSRRLARDANEFAAKMAADHKGRFGVFAVLALPDVEGCLKEIEYAFDTLKVHGVGLLTNYDAFWPGDPKFAPIWDELNRRKAVAYFHPTAAACCMNLVPQVTPAVIEFAFDTTRAIVSLLFSGTLARCPDIRWLFSHGGGTMPMLAGRIVATARNRTDLAQVAPHGVLHEIKRLHYDTVSVFDPNAFTALKALADPKRLYFGSDYPYWETAVNIDALAAHPLSPAERRAIERENALELLPRLKA
jgi:predicted TIM-barrel fold metal-dependent hydrolase